MSATKCTFSQSIWNNKNMNYINLTLFFIKKLLEPDVSLW